MNSTKWSRIAGSSFVESKRRQRTKVRPQLCDIRRMQVRCAFVGRRLRAKSAAYCNSPARFEPQFAQARAASRAHSSAGRPLLPSLMPSATCSRLTALISIAIFGYCRYAAPNGAAPATRDTQSSSAGVSQVASRKRMARSSSEPVREWKPSMARGSFVTVLKD